jgi:YidC/Oxa1 family membrane protein insertase
MIPALQFFQKLTGSYGWAIILLTIGVRIIVAPFVWSSTKSMQRMSRLQPQLKLIQERYKDNPEMFQKKAMEFYSKNKINPMGGCLPTLVQLPILFALFATFTGPPFGDKPVDVKVKVVAAADAAQVHKDEASKASIPYVSADRVLAKVAVYPGESTVVAGDSIDFGTRAVEGTLPPGFKVTWRVTSPGKDGKQLLEDVQLDDKGHAKFLKPGEYHVQAMVPGIAKGERFLLINGLGKVAQGTALLQPQNWDSLSLIILFGFTMFLSQKFTVATPKAAPGGQLDEQQIIQQQTMKTMPIAVTVMFFFIPLPTGVYLYMVISNVIQSLQTGLMMKLVPAGELVNVLHDSGNQEIIETTANKVGAAPPVVQASYTDAPNGDSQKRKKKKKKK